MWVLERGSHAAVTVFVREVGITTRGLLCRHRGQPGPQHLRPCWKFSFASAAAVPGMGQGTARSGASLPARHGDFVPEDRG